MKYIYGGTARNFGRFGVINTGDVLDLTLYQAREIQFDPNFAPLPTPSRTEMTVVSPYTILLSDYGKLIHVTHVAASSLTLPASPPLGWWVEMVDDSVSLLNGNPTLIHKQGGQAWVPRANSVHVRTADKGSNVTTLGPGSPGLFCVEPLVAGDLVFINAQTDATQNGVYVVPAISAAISDALRYSGSNQWQELTDQAVIIDHGDNDNFYFDGDIYLQTTGGQIALGTSQLVFAKVYDAWVDSAYLTVNKRSMGMYWNAVGWVPF